MLFLVGLELEPRRLWRCASHLRLGSVQLFGAAALMTGWPCCWRGLAHRAGGLARAGDELHAIGLACWPSAT